MTGTVVVGGAVSRFVAMMALEGPCPVPRHPGIIKSGQLALDDVTLRTTSGEAQIPYSPNPRRTHTE